MSNSLKDIPSETLQRELTQQGDNRLDPIKDEPTAEIVKIGFGEGLK